MPPASKKLEGQMAFGSYVGLSVHHAFLVSKIS